MFRRLDIFSIPIGLLLAAAICASTSAAPHSDGQLRLEVVDAESGQPMAARMHLKNAAGRPVKLNLPGTAEFGGHFYIDGKITLPLSRGQYTFELDAGPEYRLQSGHFEIERHADDTKRIELHRVVNLAKEGWWGGDLDVSRRHVDLPLILKAEGLTGGTIADCGLRMADSPEQAEIRNPQSEIAPIPYAWNLPVWLAHDELVGIELIHRHALRDGVVDNEEDGRPRDRKLYVGPLGNGRWSEAVYYHVLNCGFRIPPVAGSGSGSNENPVGTNRVYVFCDEAFSTEKWRASLLAGRVFVSNGPLLRSHVEGQPPGYVFQMSTQGKLSLDIGLDLATRVPVDYLQIIKNGEVDAEVRLADFADGPGRLPPVEFADSGWFLVRAATSNHRVYQFASTGPYYVERGGKPRISRRSVQFFLDWIAAAEQRIRDLSDLSDGERQSMLAAQKSARDFFENRLLAANAD